MTWTSVPEDSAGLASSKAELPLPLRTSSPLADDCTAPRDPRLTLQEERSSKEPPQGLDLAKRSTSLPQRPQRHHLNLPRSVTVCNDEVASCAHSALHPSLSHEPGPSTPHARPCSFPRSSTERHQAPSTTTPSSRLSYWSSATCRAPTPSSSTTSHLRSTSLLPTSLLRTSLLPTPSGSTPVTYHPASSYAPLPRLTHAGSDPLIATCTLSRAGSEELVSRFKSSESKTEAQPLHSQAAEANLLPASESSPGPPRPRDANPVSSGVEERVDDQHALCSRTERPPSRHPAASHGQDSRLKGRPNCRSSSSSSYSSSPSSTTSSPSVTDGPASESARMGGMRMDSNEPMDPRHISTLARRHSIQMQGLLAKTHCQGVQRKACGNSPGLQLRRQVLPAPMDCNVFHWAALARMDAKQGLSPGSSV